MKKIIYIFIFIGLTIGNVSAYTSNMLDSANSLAKKEIIKDNNNTPEKYNLDSNVLRQEIALISRRASGIKENPACKNIFSDVFSTIPNTWACQNIEALVDNNLISKNDIFRPEDNISKSEALIMFIKAIGFSDFIIDEKSEKNWQEQVVEFATKKGITEEFTDYNTQAKRGWIFELANNSININDEKEAEKVLINELWELFE